MIITTLLVILHILAASVWLGLSIRLGSQAKFAATGQHAVAVDGTRTLSLMSIMLIALFVFSMALLIVGGGYPGNTQYHIASTLIVFLMAIQFVFLRPAWNKLLVAVETQQIQRSSIYARRVSMFAGMGHLLWVTLLILMFWNRFSFVAVG